MTCLLVEVAIWYIGLSFTWHSVQQHSDGSFCSRKWERKTGIVELPPIQKNSTELKFFLVLLLLLLK